MTDPQPEKLLLTDATMVIFFCDAGEDHARAMTAHLGTSVCMVTEVHEELLRIAEERPHPVLAELLQEWPSTEIIEIGSAARLRVVDKLKLNERLGLHKNKDLGETATIFHADEERKIGGQEYLLVLDERDAKNQADVLRLKIKGTPELILDMVCAGVLTENQGQRVWNLRYTDPHRRPNYREKLKQRHS